MKYERVGIICAMEKEAEVIREAMEERREEEIGSLRFTLGKIGSRQVILAVCGIGKVFAAMCTQTLILQYKPQCLINSGVAGSLSEELEILSLAVAENLVQHDMDTSPLGDPVGMISGPNLVYFPAEKELSDRFCALARGEGISFLRGTVASGDQFIAKKEQKERIRGLFSAIACEMEGAAVAQVAYTNGVPFAVLRSISDSYLGKNEMDYAEFATRAAHHGARLLLAFLREE